MHDKYIGIIIISFTVIINLTGYIALLLILYPKIVEVKGTYSINEMNIFITVLTGVFIFIIGRWIEKFYIDPIKEQKMVISDVYDTLTFFANKYTNPLIISRELKQEDEAFYDKKIEEFNKISYEIRKLSTKLRGHTFNIKFYSIYSFFGNVPSKDDILDACAELIGLSNNLIAFEESKRSLANENIKSKERIFIKLRIKKFEEYSNKRPLS